MQVGRLVPGFPKGASGVVQETLLQADKSTQEIPKKSSQSCLESSVEVERLAQEASAINLFKNIPKIDMPSQEFPGKSDLQVCEVPEDINPSFQSLSEVIVPLPQVQCLSSDSRHQCQSPIHDQHSPYPPATHE